MKPSLALLFSIISVVLLSGIGFAIATKILWLTLIITVAAFGWIGLGFALKARLNK